MFRLLLPLLLCCLVAPLAAADELEMVTRSAQQRLNEGDDLRGRGELRRALELLQRQRTGAATINDIGAAAARLGMLDQALDLFHQARSNAETPTERHEASLNLARALLAKDDRTGAIEVIHSLEEELPRHPESTPQARLIVALSHLQRRAELPAGRIEPRLRAVLTWAESADKAEWRVAALDALARVAHRDRRLAGAMEFDHRALLAAQRARLPESEFRIRHRLARALRDSGHRDQAIALYRQALVDLAPIRQRLLGETLLRGGSFREGGGAIYYELADLLLQRAEAYRGAGRQTAEARRQRGGRDSLPHRPR